MSISHSSSLLVFVSFMVVLGAAEYRQKRQLSPAVRLQNELHPIFTQMYGYGEPQAYKRSLHELKRHISPSYDVEVDAGNMRTLLDIGKRQINDLRDIGGQFNVYSRLMDAGKKKRSLSPAHEFESQLAMNEFLGRAGRK